MGHRTIIYGYIEGMWAGGQLAKNEFMRRQNEVAIAALPESDEWPFLTGGIFGISGRTPDAGHYRGHVVHFGGSFKEIEDDWSQWLGKFEALLRRLYWTTVEVRLVTELNGSFTFRWAAAATAIRRMVFEEPPAPVTEWLFEGDAPPANRTPV